jgi:hypothetical protein
VALKGTTTRSIIGCMPEEIIGGQDWHPAQRSKAGSLVVFSGAFGSLRKSRSDARGEKEDARLAGHQA